MDQKKTKKTPLVAFWGMYTEQKHVWSIFKNYCIKDDDNLSSGAEVTSVWKRKVFEETWSK